MGTNITVMSQRVVPAPLRAEMPLSVVTLEKWFTQINPGRQIVGSQWEELLCEDCGGLATDAISA